MAGLPRISWTINRALAVTALALGALALAGNPVRGHVVRIDTQELATIVESKVDHVTASDLADWIVRGASDYRLVDIRTPDEFATYHIPTAENVPIAELPDYGLGRNGRIVLYSEGGIHSAQAWMLLRAQKYTGVYILFGGLEAWNDEVLHPQAPADSTPTSLAAFAKAAAVARGFGGAPRAASAAGADSPTLAVSPAPASPQVVAPIAPASPAVKPAAAKKNREGC